MTAVHAAKAVLVSAFRRDDEPVLVAMPLKPDTDPAALSHFSDDRWNLAPAIFRGNIQPGHRALDFGAIADPLQKLTAKEFIWARLNTYGARVRAGRLVPSQAYNVLRTLKQFMAFVAERHGAFSMGSVDQSLLDSYLAALRTGQRGRDRVATLIQVIIHLHRHSALLTAGGFTFEPWRGRSAVKIAGVRPSENRTPRIPEPAIAALLRWSFKYIDLFSADIFTGREEYDRLTANSRVINVYTSAGRGRANSIDDLVAARLRCFLDQRRQSGRGVPIWQHPIKVEIDAGIGVPLNYALIDLHIGCATRSLKRLAVQQMLRNAVAAMGLEIGGMDTAISVDPDTGKPWRVRFDAMSLMHEEKMLQAACYIVCSYLTGMRDSEVQAMRTGCHEVKRSADGLVERHLVRSTIYKVRGHGGRGTPGQWITIAPVARAIEVLERLSRTARTRHKSDGLWPALRDKTRTTAHLNAQAYLSINQFRAHLDSMFGAPDAPAIPFGPDGRPWHLTTLQFRRTVAWYIANRPFGTVAGKIQYKHASIAMFEGYAGSSASGFRREVDQERALGRLDDIVEHYEEFRRGLKPTGPASARLLTEFGRVQHELGDFAGSVVDHTRLKAMLAHLARTLHVGVLNDCFFESATALCLKRSNATAQPTPILSHCSPDRCPNACIAPRHVPAWEESIAQADKLLALPHLPAMQRRALEQDNARKRLLIAPLIKESP